MRFTRKLLRASVLLAACNGNSLSPQAKPPSAVEVVDGLTYQAQMTVETQVPTSIRVSVKVTNSTERPIRVELPGGCPVLVRAYRNESRSGAAVWDQGGIIVCQAWLLLADFASRESRSFATVVGASEILGDSLTAGRRYYFTAVVRPNRRTLELAAGEAEVVR